MSKPGFRITSFKTTSFKTTSMLSLAFVTLSGSSLAYAAANPPPLDNITSAPAATVGDPMPATPPLITDPSVAVPEPAGLSTYVSDGAALLKFGKALFWDMQLGSDGIQACASCHFKAGRPLLTVVHRIHVSQKRPNAVASVLSTLAA